MLNHWDMHYRGSGTKAGSEMLVEFQGLLFLKVLIAEGS